MSNPLLFAGVPAPWFKCRTRVNDHFSFDTVAGRYIVLFFFGHATNPVCSGIIEWVHANRQRFNPDNVCYFGVGVDPGDEQNGRVADQLPGIRYFWDFDRKVSTLYGAAMPDGNYCPVIYILDPGLRIYSVFPVTSTSDSHITDLCETIDKLPPAAPPHRANVQAPVLIVPRIFEPELCKTLIEYYETHGGEDSGSMRDVQGKTKLFIDYKHKRRRDCTITDKDLGNICKLRINDRLVPEIYKAYQFQVTRMERYIIACYDSVEGGHFRPHRDNTTKGTAHRRFAVSLFLNTGEYKGGYLRFPEYGQGLYTAPTGGAVVFSCSMLHEATPVVNGKRYMFLPFLYDEAARRIREDNFHYLDNGGESIPMDMLSPDSSVN